MVTLPAQLARRCETNTQVRRRGSAPIANMALRARHVKSVMCRHHVSGNIPTSLDPEVRFLSLSFLYLDSSSPLGINKADSA